MGGLRVPLFLVGAVAILSGGLKARERTRAYYGGVGMGLLEILVGVGCMVAGMPGVANNDMMAGLIYLAGGVIFVSTISRGLEASKLRKGQGDSESRRLYSQIKYGEALAGMTLPEGVTPSLGNNTSDRSPAEGGSAADPMLTGDPPEQMPGDEPPTTIERTDPWTD